MPAAEIVRDACRAFQRWSWPRFSTVRSCLPRASVPVARGKNQQSAHRIHQRTCPSGRRRGHVGHGSWALGFRMQVMGHGSRSAEPAAADVEDAALEGAAKLARAAHSGLKARVPMLPIWVPIWAREGGQRLPIWVPISVWGASRLPLIFANVSSFFCYFWGFRFLPIWVPSCCPAMECTCQWVWEPHGR